MEDFDREMIERLGRIEGKLDVIKLRQDELDKWKEKTHNALWGNGKPGLILDVQNIKIKFAGIAIVVALVAQILVNVVSRRIYDKRPYVDGTFQSERNDKNR